MESAGENQAAVAPVGDARWIELRPSLRALVLTAAAAGAALAVIVLAPLPLWPRVGFIVLWVAASLIEFRAQRLQAGGSVLALRLFERERAAVARGEAALAIEVCTRRDVQKGAAAPSPRRGVVLDGCFVAPWFTAIRFRLDDDPAWRRAWPRVVALWPDSIDAEQFRQLRVLLKWK